MTQIYPQERYSSRAKKALGRALGHIFHGQGVIHELQAVARGGSQLQRDRLAGREREQFIRVAAGQAAPGRERGPGQLHRDGQAAVAGAGQAEDQDGIIGIDGKGRELHPVLRVALRG